MQVAVIDQNRRPLAPTSAVRARLLLKKGKAAVFRRAPLAIILKRVVEEQVPDLRLKLDPGSRKTGVAIWIDAACVGKSTPAQVFVDGVIPLEIKATGHNTRQMCRMDKYGFPRTSAKGPRTIKGFRTGDMVKAIVRSGKKIGCYVGRVAVRSSGSFNVKTAAGNIQGISHRYCRVLQKADGYRINRAGARSQNSSPSKPPKMAAMEGVSF